jgi:two-component system, OmpR family, response regulator RegX3
MATHILVVTDDPLESKLLTVILTAQGYTTRILTDPRALTATLHEQATDLVLADTRLPYLNGFTLCAQLKQHHPDTPLILLSAPTTTAQLVQAFSQGADDFITRPYDPAVLLARLAAVLRRYRRQERGAESVVVRVGGTQLDLGRLTFRTAGGREVLITPTEMRLLECLMRNAHMVITREKLIRQTWGYESANADNRIDVYMRRLRQKIEASPTESNLIRTIRGIGYVYQGDQLAQPLGGDDTLQQVALTADG